MGIYREPNAEELNVIKKYSKLFENIRVSESVLLGGKKYKEVVFKKKGLGKAEEYLYLDENNSLVENRNTIARVGRLVFFMDVFLSDDSGSIINALQGNEEVTKNKDDLELMSKGLKLLLTKDKKYDIDKSEIEKVQAILNKLLDLRGKTNEKLKVFLDSVDKAMKNKTYFDEEVIEACMPMYKEVMGCNYEKVQLIAKGASHYNKIKKAAEKLRKSYNIRFITSNTETLSKVSYMMGYFENLLKSYRNIVEMNYNEYLKGIMNSGKVNADLKASALRAGK